MALTQSIFTTLTRTRCGRLLYRILPKWDENCRR
jgi:hypothetical protein